MGELALIDGVGSDSRLRDVCWTLLEEQLATHADLLEQGSIYLDGSKRKVGASGRAVAVLVRRDQVAQVMKRMVEIYGDGELRVLALPVLATHQQ